MDHLQASRAPSGRSAVGPRASWQSLKRHADLLPLRPHPSYFLSCPPRRYPCPLSLSTRTTAEAERVAQFPSAPQGVARHADRGHLFRRPFGRDHRSPTTDVEVESGRVFHSDHLQCGQCRNVWPPIFIRTESPPVSPFTKSSIPKVTSDPFFRYEDSRSAGGISVYNRRHSLSDLSERRSRSGRTLSGCDRSRTVTGTGYGSKPAGDQHLSQRPASGWACHDRRSTPLSLCTAAQPHADNVDVTSEAPTRFAFCTVQAPSGSMVSDVYSCTKPILSTSDRSYTKTSWAHRAVNHDETHSAPSPLCPMYFAKTAHVDKVSKTELGRVPQTALCPADVHTTLYPSRGKDWGVGSSSPLHTCILQDTVTAPKPGKLLDGRMALASAQHPVSKERDGLRRSRSEPGLPWPARTDSALTPLSSARTPAVPADTLTPLSSARTPAVPADTLTPLSSARTPAVPADTNHRPAKVRAECSPESRPLHCSSLPNVTETESISDTSQTLAEDSRKKRRPSLGRDADREQREEEVIEPSKETPQREDGVNSNSRHTKRLKISDLYINCLSASDGELETISGEQIEGHNNNGKPSQPLDEHPSSETKPDVEVDVVGLSDNDVEEHSQRDTGSEKPGDRHTLRPSLDSDGLCQTSRQIRSAIMQESYEVSRMKRWHSNMRQSQVPIDTLPKQCPAEKGSSHSKYPVLCNNIPHPFSLVLNSSKEMALSGNHWNILRDTTVHGFQIPEYTMPQRSTVFKRQQCPQGLARKYDFPRYLTIETYIDNSSRSSIVSPYTSLHHPDTVRRVPQSRRERDLPTGKHTCQLSPQKLTTKLRGLPCHQPGVFRLLPDVELEVRQESSSSHDIRQSGRAQERQETVASLHGGEDTASPHPQISYPPLNNDSSERIPSSQPQASGFLRNCTQASCVPASRACSVKESLGCDTEEIVRTSPSGKPAVTGSPQLDQPDRAAGQEMCNPWDDRRLEWPVQEQPLKPVPRYLCSRSRGSAPCSHAIQRLPVTSTPKSSRPCCEKTLDLIRAEHRSVLL